MITVDAKGNPIEPLLENVSTGKAPTARDLDALIEQILSSHSAVEEIVFCGGWDFAEQFADFTDANYEPWVSDWFVCAWRRGSLRSIDELVALHSGFNTLKEMVEAHPSYRPTLATTRGRNMIECAELTAIADAYDAAQVARGDQRRAHRN